MTDLRVHTNATLGIRNNNPGNIRYDGTKWIGSTGSNKGFVTFKDVEHGIRAMAVVIRNNINKGNDTIAKYITRYAPPSENDTTAYINNVSNNSGISPNQTLQTDSSTLYKLIKAQIKVENGQDASYVTDKNIVDGINLIGNTLPPAAVLGIVGLLFVLIAGYLILKL